MSENFGTVEERVAAGIAWLRESGEQFGCSLDTLREHVAQGGEFFMSSGLSCALARAGGETYYKVQARVIPSLTEAELECFDESCGSLHSETRATPLASDSYWCWTRWAVEHGFMRRYYYEEEWGTLGDEWRRQLRAVTSDV